MANGDFNIRGMNSSGHYSEVCEYGYVHGQCRCASPLKTERRVVCNNEDHLPFCYEPKHKREGAFPSA